MCEQECFVAFIEKYFMLFTRAYDHNFFFFGSCLGLNLQIILRLKNMLVFVLKDECVWGFLSQINETKISNHIRIRNAFQLLFYHIRYLLSSWISLFFVLCSRCYSFCQKYTLYVIEIEHHIRSHNMSSEFLSNHFKRCRMMQKYTKFTRFIPLILI